MNATSARRRDLNVVAATPRTGATEVFIPARGAGRLSARHLTASADDLAGVTGRPCVVMAHGIGATRDSGLDGFAEVLVAAGVDVVAFDYRGFAGSTGEPRQVVSVRRQLQDYRSAIEFARSLPGVDPDRIVVWGVSFSGGHVFQLSATDPRLAAAVALTPAVDGFAAVATMMSRQDLGYVARVVKPAVRDLIAAIGRKPPVILPIVALPGHAAALNAPGALEGMLAAAGSSWRNEFAARLLLTVGLYRPTRVAHRVACPMLVQIADLDQSAPPEAAARAAVKARATVHRYSGDHFDVYPGAPLHDRVVDDQVAFLRRVLRVRA